MLGDGSGDLGDGGQLSFAEPDLLLGQRIEGRGLSEAMRFSRRHGGHGDLRGKFYAVESAVVVVSL